MEYWNPEQPPPTTPIRSPAGSGSCVAMISRTLLTALGVRLRGGFLAVSSAGVTVVVVAMNFSPELDSPLSQLYLSTGGDTSPGLATSNWMRGTEGRLGKGISARKGRHSELVIRHCCVLRGCRPAVKYNKIDILKKLALHGNHFGAIIVDQKVSRVARP